MAITCIRLLLSFYFLLHYACATKPTIVCENKFGNYTNNSTFETNLNTLISSLGSNIETSYGFSNLSIGQNPDTVNGISLCRGDVSENMCQYCLGNASLEILKACPNRKEAIGYWDYCMIRYSFRPIFHLMATIPRDSQRSTENASDVNRYNQAMLTLMNKLCNEAAFGNSTKKFATGKETAGFETVYGLVQCNPDISGHDCFGCVVSGVRELQLWFVGRVGGRVNLPSCMLRYENYYFFQSSANETRLQVSGPSKGKSSRMIIVIVISVAIFVLTLAVCIIVYSRIQKPSKRVQNVDGTDTIESLQFDFETIKTATDDFSGLNKLGQGGFGTVYKGILIDGQYIAVERLSNDSQQGEAEFKNEVLLMSKLQHRNLLKLLGFCSEGNHRLLIYEFVPNGSLDQFIFDPVKSMYLDWQKRYKIIVGIAKGLLYLHEDSRHRVIHRDLKASNVLLDAEMNPRISDFGLARPLVMDQTHDNTARVAGTFGYMAPEYVRHGKFSSKSDVFSFDVLILEIISGKRSGCFSNEENTDDLLTYAWRNWKAGTASNVIDPSLRNGSDSIAEMARCIQVGLLCIQEDIIERPSMASLMLMISTCFYTLPLPSQPSNFTRRNTESTTLIYDNI